jgi:hypothetical protein
MNIHRCSSPWKGSIEWRFLFFFDDFQKRKRFLRVRVFTSAIWRTVYTRWCCYVRRSSFRKTEKRAHVFFRINNALKCIARAWDKINYYACTYYTSARTSVANYSVRPKTVLNVRTRKVYDSWHGRWLRAEAAMYGYDNVVFRTRAQKMRLTVGLLPRNGLRCAYQFFYRQLTRRRSRARSLLRRSEPLRVWPGE